MLSELTVNDLHYCYQNSLWISVHCHQNSRRMCTNVILKHGEWQCALLLSEFTVNVCIVTRTNGEWVYTNVIRTHGEWLFTIVIRTHWISVHCYQNSRWMYTNVIRTHSEWVCTNVIRTHSEWVCTVIRTHGVLMCNIVIRTQVNNSVH